MQSFIQHRQIRQSVQTRSLTKETVHHERQATGLPQWTRQSDCRDRDAGTTNIPPPADPQLSLPSAEHQQHASISALHPSTRCDVEKQEGGSKSPYFLVGFDGADDPMDPMNWPLSYKWLVTGVVSITSFIVTGASAIDTEVVPQIMRDFGVGEEVALLGTALFMIAFGLGSLVSAPFSEILGRNPVYIISLLVFALFTMGAALAPDAGSWLVCRFFAGLFGCPPLTNFGGTTADLWSPAERTYVFPVLLCLCFLGPFLAPMVASFIGASSLVSWQWTEWLTLILTGALLLAFVLFVPETYSPVLLSWKAEAMRKATGSDLYRSEHEMEVVSLYKRLQSSVRLPLKFLLTEPIIQLFSFYMTVIYTVLFGFLPGYSFIFGSRGIYGLDQANTGLCFIGINIGFLLSIPPVWPVYKRFKQRLANAVKEGKNKVVPEERLTHALIGAPLLPISIFWMGWTSWSSVSIWSPLAASVVFGFAVMQLYISCYQYIIDSYEVFAASALVGMTLTRYCVAGPMVIVSVPMYHNLGVHWTLTLLGGVATLLAPVPFVFKYYGVEARKRSKGATSFE